MRLGRSACLLKCPRTLKDLIIAALVLDTYTSSATMKDYAKSEHKRLVYMYHDS